jgi:hypothetical protein
MLEPHLADDAPSNQPVTRHCDLTVHGAREEWQRIRWALFVFPDITDVAPTDDPQVVRVFYEGNRPYPAVWRIELRQQGFDLTPGDPCDSSGHPVPAVPSAAPGYAGAPAESSS